MSGHAGLLALLCALLASRPTTAWAEPPRDQTAAYGAAVEQAVQAYAAGDLPRARRHFAEADALSSNARTLYGLGMVEVDLGQHASAVGHLEAALASTSHPLDPKQRASAQQSLARAAREVGIYPLTLEPAAARVELDGAPVPTPRLVLTPGDHTLRIAADGFVAQTHAVRAHAGEQRTLAFTLVRSQLPTRAAQPRSRGPWIALGAAGALVVTGGVLLGLARADASKVEDASPGARWKSGYDDAYARADSRAKAGFVLAGIGVAAVGASVGWWVVSRRRGDRRVALSWSGDQLLLDARF